LVSSSPEVDLQRVRAVARVARIHEEIMALPTSYDTALGQERHCAVGRSGVPGCAVGHSS